MKNSWLNIIKSLSSFNEGEKRAMFILILSIGVMLLFLLTKDLKENQAISSSQKSKIDSLYALIDTSSNNYSKKNKKLKPKDEKEYVLQEFNPNTASKEKLLRLGIPAKTTQTILNFRNKNGVFYKPKDLQKIYGLSPTLYKQLAPYVKIPMSESWKKKKKKKKKKKNFDEKPVIIEEGLPADSSINSKPRYSHAKKIESQEKQESVVRLVNINTADSLTLIKVRGIGPYFSKAIIKRRNALGGYYDINQLKEIYHLTDSIFLNIRDQLIVNGNVNKIDLNMTDIKTLAKHPYISWSQARLIIKYRDQHGPYRKVGELIKIKAFDQEFYRKIAPYLST